MSHFCLNEEVDYSPARHYLDTSESIAQGGNDPIAASNLLSGIEMGEVGLKDLPIPLRDIEKVAGRKLNTPIV